MLGKFDFVTFDIAESGSWVQIEFTKTESGDPDRIRVIVSDKHDDIWTASFTGEEFAKNAVAATLPQQVYTERFRKAFQFEGQESGFLVVFTCGTGNEGKLSWKQKTTLGPRELGCLVLKRCDHPGKLLKETGALVQSLIRNTQESAQSVAEKEQLKAQRDKAIAARAELDEELYSGIAAYVGDLKARNRELEECHDFDLLTLWRDPPKNDEAEAVVSPTRGRGNGSRARGARGGRGRGRGTTVVTSPPVSNSTRSTNNNKPSTSVAASSSAVPNKRRHESPIPIDDSGDQLTVSDDDTIDNTASDERTTVDDSDIDCVDENDKF